ncbi:MAG: MoxR family ATPase [Leptolyngbyaceae cyanobacterium MAG.088]|nr:MoxR family ATPase [Leptolyngbyaceae cyanobacterium MAG.088]
MSELQTSIKDIGQTLETVIVGQSALVHQLLVSLLAGGHVILEGVPGTGKTLMVKVIARLIQAEFCRIQLTPDILPSDILGTNVFDLNTRNFTLKKGPIFTQVLLADEVNRTPPKTQAALLEAMEEQQVTLDGVRHPLPDLFWVIATQNSLEFEGTYPLPEAQLDRFLFKLVVDYPDPKAEKQMLRNAQAGFEARRLNIKNLQAITQATEILKARQAVKKITVQDPVLDYILALVQATRQSADLSLGASPRSAVSWLQASKAHAWLAGQTYVTPDNVKAVALPLLRHRLIMGPEAQLDGLTTDAVIDNILNRIAVPR